MIYLFRLLSFIKYSVSWGVYFLLEPEKLEYEFFHVKISVSNNTFHSLTLDASLQVNGRENLREFSLSG